MTLAELIELEDKEIFNRSIENFADENPFGQNIDLLLIEANDKVASIAKKVHLEIISRLIFSYLHSRFNNAECIAEKCFNIDSSEILRVSNVEAIPTLCEALHISFLNSKFSIPKKGSKVRSKSKEQLIELGAVYTQSSIAKSIVENAFLAKPTNLNNCKVLDFACGTGRFFEHIVEMFDNKPLAILKNIYAIDIDSIALSITRLKAISFFDSLSDEDCRVLCSHIVLKNGLRKANSLFPEDEYLNTSDLDGLTEMGFDIIVSNPPYLVLKPNKSKAGVGESDKVQEQVTYFRTCGIYTYAIEGMLNLYQLSIERMLQMLKIGGVLGVICPSTLFGDVSATKLRKFLLLHNQVLSIQFFAEKIPLFENVNQATNIFILEKGGTSDCISISENGETFVVQLNLVKELFPDNLEIPIIQSTEWDILRKLAVFSKLKDCKSVRNRRGELDLSICKDYITSTPTPYRLVRGNMIGEHEVKEGNGEFVIEEFISTRSADYRTYDFNRRRLICQQISNGGLKRRLRFIFCDDKDILGNSCNYISANEELLDKLYLILNSSVMNWRFKITSSNNHINNYELAELPIVDLDRVDTTVNFSSQKELDEYIGKLYGLNKKEIELIAI